jgi:hypothetical protein
MHRTLVTTYSDTWFCLTRIAACADPSIRRALRKPPSTTSELIMAKNPRKQKARDVGPLDQKPLNPLGDTNWRLTGRHGPRARAEAVLTMHCTGIHALARLLANSETLRDVQANCTNVAPGHWPLNGNITHGLFTALLSLSERAEALSVSLPDTSIAK